MMGSFLGKSIPLTQHGIDLAANEIGADSTLLWALIAVETGGFGFLEDRRPKILFERRIFHRRTGGRFSVEHPDISSESSGNSESSKEYLGGIYEYDRLSRAIMLDRRAAFESTSWGLPQIMGFNALKLGYSGAEEMVSQFLDSEDAQLDAMRKFIVNNTGLLSALLQKNWKRIAFYYNGSGYERNKYDEKLESYYEIYRKHGAPNVEIRTAQAYLFYLGFNPKGVDGIIGSNTRAALLAFQKKRKIPSTGDLDKLTADELELVANENNPFKF